MKAFLFYPTLFVSLLGSENSLAQYTCTARLLPTFDIGQTLAFPNLNTDRRYRSTRIDNFVFTATEIEPSRTVLELSIRELGSSALSSRVITLVPGGVLPDPSLELRLPYNTGVARLECVVSP